MNAPRPKLEGLFNGSDTAEPKLSWLGAPAAEPEPAAPSTPAAPTPQAAPTQQAAPIAPVPPAPRAPAPEPVGLFDPVALAERYFAMLQALLDLQRDVGLRLAHQVAELPGMSRLRR
ncbi:hypothetical protein [Nakamurella multipartita]|jgi:hypothetical protein|uniref:Uncharacterized protein n=1 Tax=Nakamurella multipartita (strain ATCC 700099 / DSM 44233 / CIP 104796 / JCM 9543 / NBRC 105858 / Y-104) TaxID=479431 RepID=C8XBU8_NAKMY|nr:hypothetical protein [Nakamurella multipartita]ACV79452.1 hypothetical protein Namu_3119 [Nakamurella multipartita DSM 44233]